VVKRPSQIGLGRTRGVRCHNTSLGPLMLDGTQAGCHIIAMNDSDALQLVDIMYMMLEFGFQGSVTNDQFVISFASFTSFTPSMASVWTSSRLNLFSMGAVEALAPSSAIVSLAKALGGNTHYSSTDPPRHPSTAHEPAFGRVRGNCYESARRARESEKPTHCRALTTNPMRSGSSASRLILATISKSIPGISLTKRISSFACSPPIKADSSSRKRWIQRG
jgi:hypothetical protein